MPDELDRLFELLVTGLSKDNRLAVPFPAAEVYERLVPYRSNRSHLNVATHQDYEMTVLRLLAGERGYLRLEPDDVREAMQREVTATSPDTAYFRNFPDCRVMINRLAAERFLRGDMRYGPPEPEEEEEEEPVSWTGENPISPAPGERPSAPGAISSAPSVAASVLPSGISKKDAPAGTVCSTGAANPGRPCGAGR